MKFTSLLSYFVNHQYHQFEFRFKMLSNTMICYAPYIMLTPLKMFIYSKYSFNVCNRFGLFPSTLLAADFQTDT